MDSNLRQLQEDLLTEWGKLEGQVTKLDLWMAENGHVVTNASSEQTRQLFKRKQFCEQEIQSKIFEVVDELQLHKERILVQVQKFSQIALKFKEFRSEDQDNISEDDIIAEVKIEVDLEDPQDSSDFMQDPLEYSDNDFQSNSNDAQDYLPPNETGIRSKEFLCRKKCGNRFGTLEWLERHEENCKSNPLVTCSICSKTVKKKSLVNHMKLVHKKQKPIKSQKSKPFPCSHCSKRFASKDMLSYHMRAIQGERPYVCGKGCNASFLAIGHRNRHEQTCTGEATSRRGRKQVYSSPSTSESTGISKSIDCSQCSENFSCYEALQDHLRTVHSERPWICRKNCRARFLLSQHRNRHEKGCTGEFSGRRGRKPVFSSSREQPVKSEDDS